MNPRNIWCVGRNYADHARELGNEVPQKPLIFLKAGSCYTPSDVPLRLPSFSRDVHHEVELAVELNQNGGAHRACVALDLTARDLQAELKKAGQPWTLAKSFPQACPMGTPFSIESLAELEDLELRLTVNGNLRQHGYIKQMIFSIPQLVGYVEAHFPVCPGDWLLTGTPAGVGPLRTNDEVFAEIPGKSQGRWRVVS